MTTPAKYAWRQALYFRPDEIEALKAGGRVTRTFPVRLPYGLPVPLLPEDFAAMKAGKHVLKGGDSFSPPFLEVGTVLFVMSSEPPRQPPGLRPEDLEAVLSGKTVTKYPEKDAGTEGRSPPLPLPDLRVKLVDYRQEGPDHIYTFEAA